MRNSSTDLVAEPQWHPEYLYWYWPGFYVWWTQNLQLNTQLGTLPVSLPRADHRFMTTPPFRRVIPEPDEEVVFERRAISLASSEPQRVEPQLAIEMEPERESENTGQVEIDMGNAQVVRYRTPSSRQNKEVKFVQCAQSSGNFEEQTQKGGVEIEILNDQEIENWCSVENWAEGATLVENFENFELLQENTGGMTEIVCASETEAEKVEECPKNVCVLQSLRKTENFPLADPKASASENCENFKTIDFSESGITLGRGEE